ncbi:hypothetical protein AZE42_12047 [Rhizopogon vesiculosus]|uniref:Uncharacterized protein n=1 Tax=Rhizopogon vesiculosus TaxID=180088 RepID=A0A1J8QYV3_9AGAM|nr:hypothetical protein AZE42_12047 [Rhizopogon vesiculosus]
MYFLHFLIVTPQVPFATCVIPEAFEVARPIFRSTFSPDGQFIHPELSLSDRTIRPGSSDSITSITSFADRTTLLFPPTI